MMPMQMPMRPPMQPRLAQPMQRMQPLQPHQLSPMGRQLLKQHLMAHAMKLHAQKMSNNPVMQTLAPGAPSPMGAPGGMGAPSPAPFQPASPMLGGGMPH